MSKVKSSTSERQELIASLIRAGRISSQGDVVLELEKRGVHLTQATASRDLRELGAMKATNKSGNVRYVLSEPASQRTRGLGESLVISMAVSGNLVVVKTPIAGASLLASAIDQAVESKKLTGAIGTIAGDDTVLVVASTPQGGKALSKKIEELFGKAE